MARNTSTLEGYEGFLEDFEKLWGCGWKLITIPEYPEAVRLVNTNGGSHSVEVHCPITAIALECYGYESGRKCDDSELRELLGYPDFVFRGVHLADSRIPCTTGWELRKKMLRMIS